ncbi:MAG: YiiD C-terminal domain-containing protein [Moraxella sp.]|nr:YiiD C-terminal domain-containing protein [Moraxella sp.]
MLQWSFDHDDTMKSLSDFLAQIPASGALNLTIISTDKDVTLQLPYNGNTNHHGTVFGGSLSLGATLAGWAVVHEHFPQACGDIVIKHSEIRYLAPATSDVLIHATLTDDSHRVKTMLARFGKASVHTQCTLSVGETVVAKFKGVFVIKTHA